MAAYYNEIEPFAAAWLRELIKAGLIADGIVDERPIEQVEAADLKGFVQCHFFAGIGVWSYALRAAGWADDSAVWTGSCPCQSFSASGKRGGFSDKRHLWPAWFRLIGECNPHIIFGEQVAAKDGLAWLDVVSADLEGAGYALGAADTCAAGFGAPHIRQRLYFVADAAGDSASQGRLQRIEQQRLHAQGGRDSGTAGDDEREESSRMAHAESGRPQQFADSARESAGVLDAAAESPQRLQPASGHSTSLSAGDLGHAQEYGRREGRPESERQQGRPDAAQPSGDDILGDTGIRGQSGRRLNHNGGKEDARRDEAKRGGNRHDPAPPSLTNGFWANCEWLPCRDGKFRPTQPGLFPLAHGVAKRVGRLRGYGNCIVAPQAQGFIEAYSEAMQIEGREGGAE